MPAVSPVCFPDLLPGSWFEVLHIPAAQPGTRQLTGEIDQTALCDIGRALGAEFVASGAYMLRLESDDGAELIVYAIEVRAILNPHIASGVFGQLQEPLALRINFKS